MTRKLGRARITKAEHDSLLEEADAGHVGPQRLWALEREALSHGDRSVTRLLDERRERPSYSDPEYDAPDTPWWLVCQWQPHRHAVADVHPLLLRLQQARGAIFLTTEHVVTVMDAKDPEALVADWIADAPAHSSQQQRWEWEGCRRQAVPGHLFCRRHCERALKRGLAIRGGDVPGERQDALQSQLPSGRV